MFKAKLQISYTPQRTRWAETQLVSAAVAAQGPFSFPEPLAAWHADSPSLSAVLVAVYFCAPIAAAEELKHNHTCKVLCVQTFMKFFRYSKGIIHYVILITCHAGGIIHSCFIFIILNKQTMTMTEHNRF
jgi:hypothetical protein